MNLCMTLPAFEAESFWNKNLLTTNPLAVKVFFGWEEILIRHYACHLKSDSEHIEAKSKQLSWSILVTKEEARNRLLFSFCRSNE